MVSTKKCPVSFFDNLDEVKSLLAKELLIFLDYDGTLTPIVDTPDKAILSKDMKDVLIKLSNKFHVAIVSGRATDDVRQKVGLENLFYAGSHGFEIYKPNGTVKINEDAAAVREDIKKISSELADKLKSISGALVEDVKYTVSVHYRLVADKDFEFLQKCVDDVILKYPNLRKTLGKKVFEIRPNIDWHKGKAVEWILDFWEFASAEYCPVYIGDDVTDEDAFKVLEDKGLSIVVSEKQRQSAAQYRIKDVDEVKDVLQRFIGQK